MRLDDYKADYQVFSGKASDSARQLAFAGIAVVWVFKSGGALQPELPSGLVRPLVAFSGALALDLMQYVVGSVIWGLFHRHHERRLGVGSGESELSHPVALGWPIHWLFWLKIALVVLGYVLIGVHVCAKGLL